VIDGIQEAAAAAIRRGVGRSDTGGSGPMLAFATNEIVGDAAVGAVASAHQMVFMVI
jgi:hypothetical protein